MKIELGKKKHSATFKRVRVIRVRGRGTSRAVKDKLGKRKMSFRIKPRQRVTPKQSEVNKEDVHHRMEHARL